MKKLLIGVVAALCCFALAAPAVAEVKVGGMIGVDMWYMDRSSETVQGGFEKVPNAVNRREDMTRTDITLPQAWNRITLNYTSDDKVVGGYIQLRHGDGTGVGFNAYNINGSTQVLESAWIDYHFNKSTYLRIGRQTQAFAIYAPDQTMGQGEGHIVGVGFGNVHGGSGRDAIRLYHRFNENVRLEFQALSPDNVDGVNALPPAKAGGVVTVNNVIPRFDLAIPISVGNFKIEPSATWLQMEMDEVAAGSDDDVTIWGLALGLSAGFGPFSISGEITYGENLGNGNYVTDLLGQSGARSYVGTGGNTFIEDTEVLAFWVQLAFNFGPAKIEGIFGMHDSDNDGAAGVANTAREITRYMYGITVPISVTKNFLVKPEIMYYDMGSDEEDGDGDAFKTDYGDELMIGVEFRLTF